MIKNIELFKSISRIARIPEDELNSETALYGSEIISSLMMLEMMSAIEKEYRIFIRPEELVEDNFKSIGTLKTFIERKMELEGQVGMAV